MGEEVLSSPPPEPSPVKGEGGGSQVPHMTYLPLSACQGRKRDVSRPVSHRLKGVREGATITPSWMTTL
jgi:hypothetical protein